MFKIVGYIVRLTLMLMLGMTAMVGLARATPAEDAQAHFQKIASRDVAGLMIAYADSAHLYWVGGPLDGDYTGAQAIRDVWTKFADMTRPQGTLVLDVSELRVSTNPAGSTVTANLRFSGKTVIPVRYVLTYRADKIVSEVWQVAPDLAAAPGAS